MHTVFRLNLIRFLLCGLLAIPMGCATSTGSGTDIGTVINANKQLEETVDVSALEAYKATVAALRELNMSIIGEAHDSTSIKSTFTDGETAWVDITSINAVSCKVTVRVGVFAGEARSRSVLTAILKNLPNESITRTQPLKDNLNQSDDSTTGAFQQPMQNEEDSTAVDTPAQELKPLPKDVVTEKSLL